ncbi:MAG: helix-turn-helix domain-containing protein [Labilithrix sp.]|nr:helix-turn-helix domain-containing protein [Labilithrix sp.]MCW5816426.1 helix-turn-helix domain-containing protein [Labilithrix sp.]
MEPVRARVQAPQEEDPHAEDVARRPNGEASRLLETTELSVTEIGYACGFADTAHFSRRFKRRVSGG